MLTVYERDFEKRLAVLQVFVLATKTATMMGNDFECILLKVNDGKVYT